MLAPLASAQTYQWKLPEGIAPPPVPADNPMSDTKVDLGLRLFGETKLSRNMSMACGSCHWHHLAFAENRATHPGIDNTPGKRNPPPLANIGYFPVLTWANPNATSLEIQALDPVFGEHPVEMGMAGMEKVMVERIARDACYTRHFAEAFPEEKEPVTLTTIFKAIAAFQRTLISFDSPWDKARRGKGEVSERAKQGEALFAQKNCASCHSGPQFTDYTHHDIGLEPSERDAGLAEKTGRKEDANRFRTPTLRNLWLSGPFMHDGRITSVTESILAHAKAADGKPAPKVSEDEAADIAMFLETLTDKDFINNQDLVTVKFKCEAP